MLSWQILETLFEYYMERDYMDSPVTDEQKIPSIVIIGIGGGGSRIISDGLEKIVNYQMVDRYKCLTKAIRANSEKPYVFIVDTSADPTRKGFFDNIPLEQKISLSSAARGMSRGAGGRPGRAAKAVLNDEVVKTLVEKLYKPITDISPAIVVVVHTADGGTGGGLTPEVIHHLAYALPLSTIFWVFTVLPRRNPLSMRGPRTVAPNVGKLLKVARQVARQTSKADFSQIAFNCRTAIDALIERQESDQSYEFNCSRIALFPLSNHHFAQCSKDYGRKEIREEVLNPFPIELLSQALYPFLKYTMASPEEQSWMQENWPLGPIDIPDIMAGLTPERPFILPHLWIDPRIDDEAEIERVLSNFREGNIELDKIENENSEDEFGLFTFTGAPCGLHEFRASSIYCIPIYPECSEYFDYFGDFVSDEWFPKLSGALNYIGGSDGNTTGVISHAANLKPQPVPDAPPELSLGFRNGLLVTLNFGAIPTDLPIWLEATRDILKENKTEDFWELSKFDADAWLRPLSDYLGWKGWPKEKYLEQEEEASEIKK